MYISFTRDGKLIAKYRGYLYVEVPQDTAKVINKFLNRSLETELLAIVNNFNNGVYGKPKSLYDIRYTNPYTFFIKANHTLNPKNANRFKAFKAIGYHLSPIKLEYTNEPNRFNFIHIPKYKRLLVVKTYDWRFETLVDSRTVIDSKGIIHEESI